MYPHFFFLLKNRNSFTLWQNLIYPFSDISSQVRNGADFLCSSSFTRLTSVTCFQFEYRIRFLLIFMKFIFYFIYYFLSFSERWVGPTSYQHFCRCSWWSCMLLLVIRLWRTSLHTLAKHRHPRQNECKKKGSVMNKSLFSLFLRKPDSSLYSDLFPPNSEFASNSTGNEISAEYFIGRFSIDCQSDFFRHSQKKLTVN